MIVGSRSLQSSSVQILVLIVILPVQPLLVELDDNLWNFSVCLLGRDQISCFVSFPLDEEEELPGIPGGADDPLRLETPREPMGLNVIFFLLLLVRLIFLGYFRLSPVSSLLLFLDHFLLLFLGMCVELQDLVLAVEMLYWLPGVVIYAVVAFPLDQVLGLSFLLPLFNDLLNLKLFHFTVTFGVRHSGVLNRG